MLSILPEHNKDRYSLIVRNDLEESLFHVKDKWETANIAQINSALAQNGYPLVITDVTKLEVVTKESPYRIDAKNLVIRWAGSTVNVALATISKRKLNEFD